MNAKDYKKLIAKKRKTEDLNDVTLPSGAVWKMRTPPIQQFILAGKLPSALAAKMAKMAGDENPEEAAVKLLQQLSPAEFVQNLEFGRDLLLYCAVEPKISLNPQSDDEIAPTDIDPKDFDFLIGWCQSGGGLSAKLDTFREQSR